MYIVSYNLKRLFKWISDTTNRKWRDRRNGKNAGKIKMQMSCMDAIYDGVVGGGGEGEGRGGLTRKVFVTYFEFWVTPNHIQLTPFSR